MICWTSFYRESRQLADRWVIPGNLWTQNTYHPPFLKFCDPESMMLRDLDMIESTQSVLRGHCDAVEFSMAPISLFNQYQNHKLSPRPHTEEITRNWLPSFYEVLWDGNIEKVMESRSDLHPTTAEHGIYLKKVFGWDPRSQKST